MLSVQEDRTMPLPFPGMNPFLEHPNVWSTFHTRMLAAMADRLSARVRPDYLVRMEAHLWIHERADDHEDGEIEQKADRPERRFRFQA